MSTLPVALPRLLPVKQAAEYLGCTVWAVRSLIWNREIPFLRLGKRLLLDKADLDRLIEARKIGIRDSQASVSSRKTGGGTL
jgi:excisionase family DNA binding protein